LNNWNYSLFLSLFFFFFLDSYDPEKPMFPTFKPPPMFFPPSNGSGLALVPPPNLAMMNPPKAPMMSYRLEGEDIIQVGGKGFHKPHHPLPPPSRPEIERREKFERPPRREVQPPPDPNSTTLMITNIPAELNNIEKLNSHFKNFGTVINIQVRPAQERAFIQFSTQQEAEKALTSPEAVLGNRFIRVFWSNKKPRQPTTTTTTTDKPQPPMQSKEREKKEFEISKASKALPPSAPPPPPHSLPSSTFLPPSHLPTTTSIPPAVPSKEEKLKKELQKKKDDLRKMQLGQTKEFIEQLAKMKDVDPKLKAELMKKVELMTNTVASSIAKDSSTLEKTKADTLTPPLSSSFAASAIPSAKLAKLKDEKEKERENLDRELEAIAKSKEIAVSAPSSSDDKKAPSTLEKLQQRYQSLQKMAEGMGIDPNTGMPTSTATARGGGRGAGRGGTVFRGAVRGRGRGARGASVAGTARTTFALDNRTSIIRIADVPKELREGEDLLNHFKVKNKTYKKKQIFFFFFCSFL
jgi:hypothetical protein